MTVRLEKNKVRFWHDFEVLLKNIEAEEYESLQYIVDQDPIVICSDSSALDRATITISGKLKDGRKFLLEIEK